MDVPRHVNRRFARWIGPPLVVIPQLLLFVFRTDPFTAWTAVIYLSLTLAGVLFVLAGYWAPVSLFGHEMAWHVLAGLGELGLGVGFAASGVGAAIGGDQSSLLYAGTATVGGLIICFMGIDIASGGHHFRVGEPND